MSRGEPFLSDWNLGQKRARASRACKECKTNRRKCDGLDPCKPCIDAGTPELCIYEVPKKRGRRFREGQSSEKKSKFDTTHEDPTLIDIEKKSGTTDISEEPSFRLSATVPSFSFVPVISPSTSIPEVIPDIIETPTKEPRRELAIITSTTIEENIITSPSPPEPRREKTIISTTTTTTETEVSEEPVGSDRPEEEEEEEKRPPEPEETNPPTETQNQPEIEQREDIGPSEPTNEELPHLGIILSSFRDRTKKK